MAEISDTPEPPITEHIALPDDSDAHTIPPARCTLSALRDVLPPKGSIIVRGSPRTWCDVCEYVASARFFCCRCLVPSTRYTLGTC